MADQRAPGVYFEESDRRIQAIPAGVGLIGFMGQTYRGRTDRPQRVRSWADYQRLYGGFSQADDLAPKVFEFFQESGVALSVSRVLGAGAVGAYNTADFKDHSGTRTAKISAADEGVWGNDLSVSTLLYEKSVSGSVVTTDRGGVNLPANTHRAQVDTLTGMRVGDVLDVVNTATGALVVSGPVLVVGFDATTSDVFLYNPGGALSFPGETTLRCASQHRATTTLRAEATQTSNYIDVRNSEGIKKGSTLLLSLHSHKPTIAANSYTQAAAAVVSRVMGNRVYLSAVPAALSAAMATEKKSQLLLEDVAVTNGLTFTSLLDGADGNEIRITLVPGAGESVSVSGRGITINYIAADTTLTETKDLVDAHLEASQLVSVAIKGAGGTKLDTVTDKDAYLEGGALAFVVTQEFRVEVSEGANVVEVHDYLSMNPNSSDYIETRLGGTVSPLIKDNNNASQRIIFYDTDGVEDATAVAELIELPQALTNVGLSAGADGAVLYDDDYIGSASSGTGMYRFNAEDGLDGIAAPGFSSTSFQRSLVQYCENRGSLVAILDMPPSRTSADSMQTYREIVLGSDSSYAHLVGPRLLVTDRRPNVVRGSTLWMPASATFAGLLSYTLSNRGAHRSPGNLRPVTALRLEVPISELEHGALNDAGVSIFRDVAGRGILLFGDRTLLRGGDERKFGSVRRWLNFFKRSMLGTLSILSFEPANEDLFLRVQRMVDGFLDEQWQKGALYPKNNRDEAFRVKCDGESTTSQDLIDGKVYCDVMVSPVTPAERFIFRLGISSGGISVNEQN